MATTTSARKLRDTTSLCAVCKRGVEASLWEQDGRVLMRKACPQHGASEVLISSDAAWYHETLSYPAQTSPPPFVKSAVERGCPFDCGACAAHEQKAYLPVVPITSACNLDCPVCYTINKNEGAFHISLDEFAAILDVVRRNDPELRIINLTGGEPTLHPRLTEIVGMCHAAGIHRVTISTHGLTFINNEGLLSELAALRARIVLSFNSFDEAVNYRMIGARAAAGKLKALEKLARHDVDTTLIPVLALGYNDEEIGELLKLALAHDFIRSLEVHTMTFTGQSGADFDPGARLTTPDVLRRIEEQTAGRIRVDDFVPSPCAHPLCYQTCYLLQTPARGFIPFTRFMPKETIRHLLTDNLYMEPGARMEAALQDVVTQLWAAGPEDETGGAVLAALKGLLRRLFPSAPLPYHERQVIAERAAKTIYIHSHMDEENFDTDRIRQCCVGVPSADGGNVPTCAYNILYRERDPRFSARDAAPLSTFAGGRTGLVQIGRPGR